MEYLEINSYFETIKVSKLGLGTANDIMGLSKKQVFELLDTLVEAGGNLVDSAHTYLNGESEKIIGEWMYERKNRDSICISTKGCHPNHETMNISRLSAKDMESDINTSLKSLKTDHIDIYWLHKDDPSHSIEDIVDSINNIIIKPGKAKAVGTCNWSTERIEAANKYAKLSGQFGFVTSQMQWSLAVGIPEQFAKFKASVMNQNFYDWYLYNQMAVFSISLGAQTFFEILSKGKKENLNENLRLCFETTENLKRAENLMTYSREHGVSIMAAYYAFIINNKLPGIAIIDVNNPQQLIDCLSASKIKMTFEEADKIFQV